MFLQTWEIVLGQAGANTGYSIALKLRDEGNREVRNEILIDCRCDLKYLATIVDDLNYFTSY
jgi:hypothetical protein